MPYSTGEVDLRRSGPQVGHRPDDSGSRGPGPDVVATPGPHVSHPHVKESTVQDPAPEPPATETWGRGRPDRSDHTGENPVPTATPPPPQRDVEEDGPRRPRHRHPLCHPSGPVPGVQDSGRTWDRSGTPPESTGCGTPLGSPHSQSQGTKDGRGPHSKTSRGRQSCKSRDTQESRHGCCPD